MINVEFKYKGEKIRGQLPEGWQELNVKQWLALEELENEPLKMLAVLLNTDLAKIENASADLRPLLAKIAELFNERPPEVNQPTEKGIILQGKRCKFPKNLKKLLFGQLLQINMLLADEKKINANLPYIAALVIQPQLDGEFNSERVPAVAELVALSPAVEVFGDLFFFAKIVKKHAQIMRVRSQVLL